MLFKTLAGTYLIADGLLSMIYVKDKRWWMQAARIIRATIGCFIIVADF